MYYQLLYTVVLSNKYINCVSFYVSVSTILVNKLVCLSVCLLAGTGRVFQKTLSNSRVMGDDLRSAVFLAGTGKIGAILGRMMVSDQPGNVLLYAFLQPLGCRPTYRLLQWHTN